MIAAELLSKTREMALGAALVCGVPLFLGFGIETAADAPGYATVYAAPDSRTYFAPACVRGLTNASRLRRTTIAQAVRAGFKPDADCRDEEGFTETGPSLTGMLLIRLGLWPKAQHWWDAPES